MANQKDVFVELGDTFELLDYLSKEYGIDHENAYYQVWVQLTRVLTAMGWKTEDLLRDAGWHSAAQSSAPGTH